MSENISLNIHYGPHYTAQDFDFLKERLRSQDTHVYIPELNGYSDNDVSGYNKVAQGNMKAYREVLRRINPASMFAAQLGALYASRKRVELIDMPAVEFYTNPTQIALLNRKAQVRTFQDYLENHYESVALDMSVSQQRDDVMVENLLNDLPDRIASNPKLNSLASVGILMTVGDLHQNLSSQLRDAPFTVHTNEVALSDRDASERYGLAIKRGETPTEAEHVEALSAALLSSYVFDESSARRRAIMNQLTDGIESDGARDIIRLRNIGTAAVHDFINVRIKEEDIDTEGWFTTIAPGSFVPYEPALSPVILNGRPAMTHSLF